MSRRAFAVKPEGPVVAGALFQAECVAYTTIGERLFWLGSCPAETPWRAFGWITRRAASIADQLDPAYARPVHAWLADSHTHARIVEQLDAGTPYTFTICEGAVRYALTIAPDGAIGQAHLLACEVST
ncbi:hypothetical protein [Streptomyces sp. Da 82-17]|uniref:hypothetical protein n=1 Tax=Streptomyces sp. Da 82-17 TaxID=3377116 RepID=UPI0038D47A3A